MGQPIFKIGAPMKHLFLVSEGEIEVRLTHYIKIGAN